MVIEDGRGGDGPHVIPDEQEIERAAMQYLILQLNEENWQLRMRIRKLEKQIESFKEIMETATPQR